MERVQKAQRLKQEKKMREDKVFSSGANWKPEATKPQAPSLTISKRQNFMSTIEHAGSFQLAD